jgi:hypothetical protein
LSRGLSARLVVVAGKPTRRRRIFVGRQKIFRPCPEGLKMPRGGVCPPQAVRAPGICPCHPRHQTPPRRGGNGVPVRRTRPSPGKPGPAVFGERPVPPARGRVIAGGFTQKIRKTTIKSTSCGGDRNRPVSLQPAGDPGPGHRKRPAAEIKPEMARGDDGAFDQARRRAKT